MLRAGRTRVLKVWQEEALRATGRIEQEPTCKRFGVKGHRASECR